MWNFEISRGNCNIILFIYFEISCETWRFLEETATSFLFIYFEISREKCNTISTLKLWDFSSKLATEHNFYLFILGFHVKLWDFSRKLQHNFYYLFWDFLWNFEVSRGNCNVISFFFLWDFSRKLQHNFYLLILKFPVKFWDVSRQLQHNVYLFILRFHVKLGDFSRKQ